MPYITPIVYVLINIIHAVWHSYLIKHNRTIFSNQKTIEYFIVSVLAAVVLIFFHLPVLPMILFALLTRMAFFDGLLNLFRGEPYLYEGEIKKKKSFVDWVENKIGWPTWVFRLLYIAAYITYLIVYLNGN